MSDSPTRLDPRQDKGTSLYRGVWVGEGEIPSTNRKGECWLVVNDRSNVVRGMVRPRWWVESWYVLNTLDSFG